MICADELEKISHEKKVQFALFCAEDVLHHSNKRTFETSKKCIELVKKWLENHDSVTEEELKDAAKSASLVGWESYTFDYEKHYGPASCAVYAAEYAILTLLKNCNFSSAHAANVAICSYPEEEQYFNKLKYKERLKKSSFLK